MDKISLLIGSSWLLTGLLSAALAIPLVRGCIGGNGLYGVRFPESFASDEAWYAINRYGGKRMLVWSLPLIATGLCCFLLPLEKNPSLTLALGFAPLVFICIPAYEAWRFARAFKGNA